jgi:hypothetical protein
MGTEGKKRRTPIELWGLPWRTSAEFVGRILIPEGPVELDGGTVHFNWGEGGFLKGTALDAFTQLLLTDGWKVVDVARPILPEFLYLNDGSDEEIAEFARKWGPLWWTGKPEHPFRFPGVLVDGEDLFLEEAWRSEKFEKWDGRESCDLYRSAANLAAFLAESAIGGSIFSGHSTENTWKDRMGPFYNTWLFGKAYGHIDSIYPAISRRILSRLLKVHMSTEKAPDEKGITMCIKDGFFPIVVAEAIKAIHESEERFCLCDNCGRLYFRDKKMPKKGMLNFCVKCREKSKGSKRFYMRRVRKEGKVS